jgi:cellulose synthase operon protein C
MKKNKLTVVPLIIFSILFVNADLSAAPAKKTTVQKSTTKKVTIGEMFKKAKDSSRGGQLQQTQKANTFVPDAKLSFQSKNTVNLGSVKPPKSTEILNNSNRSGNEVEYEKTLDRQIQELFKLTQKFSKNEARGELWLRLAELYIEKASLVDFRKQDIYDKQLKLFLDGKLKNKPKLDGQEARQYNRRAIQLYEWFMRDYPKDSKQSQALFFLGYNYFELGETAKGQRYYQELTNKFPKSSFISEAYFALGEFYFENEKWTDAYKNYAYLIKKPKHRLNSFAMYKGAWCLFRLGRTEDAIKYMDFIIRNKSASGNEGAGKSVNKSKLDIEAARDIIVFFADLGATDRAINYFNQNVSQEAKLAALEKLGYFYSDKGNQQGAYKVFNHLISENPQDKKAFEYQYQIVQNYFYAKNSPQFKQELYRWITDYGKGTPWNQANLKDKNLIETSYKLQEQTLRNYVLQQHQTAQNSRATFSQQNSLSGYKMYFDHFSDSPSVADMRFFYGELLYDMKRYDEASQQYSWVAEKAPQSKFAGKATQNILISIERALPKDEDLQKRVGDSVEPVPLDPRVARFISSAKLYLQKFPTNERAAEIKFRIGRLNYQSNQFNEAEAAFKDIVKNHPKTKYSEYSANLLLDIYNLKKDYAGLAKMGNELLQDSSISGSKAGQDIRGVLEKANFKQAQDLETEKNYQKSAEQYEAFAVQNPKSELIWMALYNAGINFERVGDNSKASVLYQRVIQSEDKKADSLKPKAKKLLAKLYQYSGRLTDSARLFEELVKENPNDPLASNYLYNAAVMQDTMGETTKALRNYNEFINTSKSAKDRTEAVLAVAELYKKSGSKSLAIEKYKEVLPALPDDSKKAEILYYLVQNDTKFLDENQKHRNRLMGLYNRLSGEAKTKTGSFVSKIKYSEVEKSYNNFIQMKIPSDPAKQKAAVDKKLEAIAQLNTELTEVIKLDSAEEIIKSINMLGDANLHMGQSILNTPLPADLNEAQKKVYQAEISKIADPFIKKAGESYKVAVDRGRDLSVYNNAYRNSYAKMGVQDPVGYYNKGEITFENRQVDWMGE